MRTYSWERLLPILRLVMPFPHSITARQAWMAPRLRTSLSCWPGPCPVQPGTQSCGTHAGAWKPSTLAPAFGLPAGLLLGPLPSSSSKYSIGQAWKGARCGLLRWLPPFISFKFYTHTNTHSYSLTESSILRPLFEKQYFHIQTHYSGLWVILSSEMTSFPPQPPSTAPGGKLGFFLPLLANSFTLGLSIMQLHLGAVSTWTLFWKQMQWLLAYVQVPQQRCEKHSVIPPGIDRLFPNL